jgi:putative transposase
MEDLRQHCPIALMSRVFEVSGSGYYTWRDRPLSPLAQQNARLEDAIRAAHKRRRKTHGPQRLQSDLADHGIQVGLDHIKRIRKKRGWRCKQTRKFKAMTEFPAQSAGGSKPAGS